MLFAKSLFDHTLKSLLTLYSFVFLKISWWKMYTTQLFRLEGNRMIRMWGQEWLYDFSPSRQWCIEVPLDLSLSVWIFFAVFCFNREFSLNLNTSFLISGLYLFLQVQLPLSLATIKHTHFVLFGWGKLIFIKCKPIKIP